MSKKKNANQRRQERNDRAKTKAGNLSRIRVSANNHPLAPSGLRNNGNTCYYNSTMQCLSQVYALFHLLELRKNPKYCWKVSVISLKNDDKTFNLENFVFPLNGERPQLIQCFLKLVKEIISKMQTSPAYLLDEIRAKYSQFRGNSQQDAHELCLNLMSQIRDEECLIQKKTIFTEYRINPKNPNTEDKFIAQKFKYVVNHTPVDAIFGGQLVSWVKCCDCLNVSFHFERFYDLSLSLPYDKHNSSNNRKDLIAEKNNYSDECESDEVVEEIEVENSNSIEQNMDKLSVSDRKKRRQQKKAARKLERKMLATSKYKKTAAKLQSDSDSDKETLENGKEQCSINNENSTNNNNHCDIGFEAIQNNTKISTDNKSKLTEANKDKNNKNLEQFCFDDKNRDDFNKTVLQPIVFHDDSFENKGLGILLKNFITVETLQGDNKYICEGCSKKENKKVYSSKAIKGQMIALPPQTLIIQLKRFEAIGLGVHHRTRNTRKCNSKVDFPARLNISPFTSRIYEVLSDFYEPEIEFSKDDQILDYDLFAVVVHLGDLQGGHYVAYVKVRKMKFEYKNIDKFVHLKQFFPDFDHVYQLWNEAQKREIIKSSKNFYSSHNCSESDSSSDCAKTNGILKERSSEASEDENNDNHVEKRLSLDDGCWFYCSDSEVRCCTEEEALRNNCAFLHESQIENNPETDYIERCIKEAIKNHSSSVLINKLISSDYYSLNNSNFKNNDDDVYLEKNHAINIENPIEIKRENESNIEIFTNQSYNSILDSFKKHLCYRVILILISILLVVPFLCLMTSYVNDINSQESISDVSLKLDELTIRRNGSDYFNFSYIIKSSNQDGSDLSSNELNFVLSDNLDFDINPKDSSKISIGKISLKSESILSNKSLKRKDDELPTNEVLH